MSASRHALLALLAEEGPAHGYLLNQRLQAKLGPAWEINSGQMSRELKTLEKEGLVRPVGGAGESQGRKRVVEPTEDGLAQAERWLVGHATGVSVSSPEFLAKINLGGPERCEASLERLTTYETECVHKLKELQDVCDKIPLYPVVAERLLKRCATIYELMQVEAQLHAARLFRKTITAVSEKGSPWGAASAQSDATEARDREEALQAMYRRMLESRLDVLPGGEDAAHGE